MASYELPIKPSAVKELETLQTKDRRRIVGKIQSLAEEPRPPACEKLTGRDRYRLRQGNLRILYEVTDADFIVTVVRIGHRREVDRWAGFSTPPTQSNHIRGSTSICVSGW